MLSLVYIRLEREATSEGNASQAATLGTAAVYEQDHQSEIRSQPPRLLHDE
jgi:hypothetical protein